LISIITENPNINVQKRLHLIYIPQIFPGQPAGGDLMIIIDETRNIHKALEHAIGRGVSLSDGSFLISAR
jgi:hypothetical protein